MATILVTGGAGYVGSHAVRELGRQGLHPLTFDNLSEGHREAVLSGKFVQGDLADETALDQVFASHSIDAVMHYASRCYVGESMEDPQLYYEQNLGNLLALLGCMRRHQVRKLVFSSSCAVYGDPTRIPIDEEHPLDPVNPYGETKYFIERMLRHYDRAYGMRFVSLRYFNACGASLDGRIGESHQPETHLIPRILQVARQEEGQLPIYGDDYPTPDGTCIRDYIHVLDLASAHLAAYKWLSEGNPSQVLNLGTGDGYSVRQVIDGAARITGRKIPSQVFPRRAGDPPQLVCAAGKVRRLLGWAPRHSSLEIILETAWKWECGRRY